jgi:hypothetical protein
MQNISSDLDRILIEKTNKINEIIKSENPD